MVEACTKSRCTLKPLEIVNSDLLFGLHTTHTHKDLLLSLWNGTSEYFPFTQVSLLKAQPIHWLHTPLTATGSAVVAVIAVPAGKAGVLAMLTEHNTAAKAQTM